jgi:hypothetical protein
MKTSADVPVSEGNQVLLESINRLLFLYVLEHCKKQVTVSSHPGDIKHARALPLSTLCFGRIARFENQRFIIIIIIIIFMFRF